MRAALLALILVALSALSALSALPGQAAVQWRTLPNAPISGRIDGLYFIDAQNGWVATGNGTIDRTTDGGNTWVEQFADPTLFMRCIAFANLQRGYAGTLITPNLLYRTTNGGTTWTQVTNIPEPMPNALCGVWAPSNLVAYGVGSYSGPARVIKTTDGGASWSSTDLFPLAETLVDVYFWNDLVGIAVGSIGAFSHESRSVVLRTTNGGATWQQRYVGSRLSEWGWKITFPTPDTGYVSLERSGPPMFLLKTVDGGLNWTELPFVDHNEQGIGFATTRVGWIGGASNPTFGTTDGGITWTETPWGEYLDRFQFLGPTLGYASGVTVYKYSEGTVAVAGPATTRMPPPAALPNPFGPRTTIRYDLANPAAVTLFVADPSGRIVRRLTQGEQGAGSYRVEWDGKNDAGHDLPAGVYLWVLHAGDRHEMGKLVRVR